MNRVAPSLPSQDLDVKERKHAEICVGSVGTGGDPPAQELSLKSPKLGDVCLYLLLSVSLCLDILMNSEADFIKEIRYLSGLMRQNCHDASWRMERLLSKVEQGESLDTRSTSIQLREARDELQLLMRGIEGIQKLCELQSDDS